jgi:hypothetical protein
MGKLLYWYNDLEEEDREKINAKITSSDWYN